MPDDAGSPDQAGRETAIPLALMAVGALSLLRGVPLAGLGLLGCWLYPMAAEADRDRHARGRSLKARRAATERLDIALEDSFPASDPPSLSGITP
jgi:hypothetical protein